MCGRFTLTASGEALAETFDLPEVPQVEPRFNIAPTQEVAVVRQSAAGERELVFLRWGLIPRWAKDPSIGNRMINARSETAAEKPSFRSAFRKRRCLVAADGFYEWRKLPDGNKQPTYLRLKSLEPFAIAGLWESWRGEEGEVESCTLLTTGPNPLVAPIHDRMPVVLDKSEYDLWLDRGTEDPARLQPLLDPFDADRMEAYAVSRFVNNPRNESPRCLEAATS